MKIPLSNPDITELEKKSVLDVLNTPNLSLGPKLAEFESRFTEYIGSKYAIAVNSGTSGLHLCMRALSIKAGDGVITTPFSFVASANCILFENAKPVFVDIEKKNLNIDVNNASDVLRKSKVKRIKIQAMLPVHVFGRPCEMDELMGLAREYDLKVIEDACEAVGAEYLESPRGRFKHGSKKEKGSITEKTDKDEKTWRKVGTFGDCGVFAFYPNKQITTGEGGMIVTDDAYLYKLCRSLRNQGRSDNNTWLQHERLGYNFRMSDINCSLGIAQLQRIDEILAKREKVANLYKERLKSFEQIIIPHSEKNKKISWFVYVIRLSDRYSMEARDSILIKLKERGIGCSNYFSPIHLQPFYRKIFGYKEGDFPVTESASKRTIALPFYNNLKEEDIDFVCKNLIKIVQSI